MKLRTLLTTLTSIGISALSVSNAHAFNDYGCKPAPNRPPVVLAHGRAGTAAGMVDIIGALEGAGYCVFGEDYGRTSPDGQTGMAHLDQSGGEFGLVVDKVLAATGAPKVNAVGYSEGGSVVDNYILAKGGAAKIHRVVSFAGGHHPYGHVGIANVIDGILYLPNTVEAVRNSVPPFTSNVKFEDVVTLALGLAPGALSPADGELVRSGFVADLFDAKYWSGLQGGLSEPSGTFASVGTTVHTVRTKDSAPNVCYTNIVSLGDTLVGASAGFLDPAPNVVNLAIPSTADHGGIISDPGALKAMLTGFDLPCAPGANGAPANGGQATQYPVQEHPIASDDATGAVDGPGAASRRAYDDPSASSGCAVSRATGSSDAAAWLLALAAAITARRHRRAPRRWAHDPTLVDRRARRGCSLLSRAGRALRTRG